MGASASFPREKKTKIRRLDLTIPTRYMGARKLLKEGLLMKAKSGRKLHAFLCSDILVLTDESVKMLYRMVRISINHFMLTTLINTILL